MVRCGHRRCGRSANLRHGGRDPDNPNRSKSTALTVPDALKVARRAAARPPAQNCCAAVLDGSANDSAASVSQYPGGTSAAARAPALKPAKGDRAFAELLLVARETGLEALEMACQLAPELGHLKTSVVLNEIRRLISAPHGRHDGNA